MADILRVNGNIIAYNSYILMINGLRYTGLTEVSYGDKVEIAMVKGMRRSGVPIGSTPGTYVCDPIKLKLYQHTVDNLRQDLMQASNVKFEGLSGYRFQVSLQYQEVNLLATYLDFINCRWISESSSLSEGSEAAMTEIELQPEYLIHNDITKFRVD